MHTLKLHLILAKYIIIVGRLFLFLCLLRFASSVIYHSFLRTLDKIQQHDQFNILLCVPVSVSGGWLEEIPFHQKAGLQEDFKENIKKKVEVQLKGKCTKITKKISIFL